MSKDAGCLKGKGATAANEARKCALSVAEEAAQKNGDSIPEPSFNNSDDNVPMIINQPAMTTKTNMFNSSTRSKAQATSKSAKAAAKLATVPSKLKQLKSKPDTSALFTATVKPHTKKETSSTKEVEYLPPALDGLSSDEDSDAKLNDNDDNGEDSEEDDKEDEDNDIAVTAAQFAAETSHTKPAAKVFESDDEGFDDADEIIRGSSPPPRSDGAESDDSGSEPELIASTIKQNSKTMRSTPSVNSDRKGVSAPQKKQKEKTKKPIVVQKTETTGTINAVERKWSVHATTVRNLENEYNIRDQPTTLKAVLSCSIVVTYQYATSATMFPGYATPTSFMHNLLLQVVKDIARWLGADEDTKAHAKEIFERFQRDPTFVQKLTDIPMTRFLQLRSGSKTVAQNIIDMHYGFLPTLTASKVKALARSELKKDNLNLQNGAPSKSTLYHHSAVKALCQKWLFGYKGQVGKKIRSYFIQLGQERTGVSVNVPPNEGELSIPVVATVATAIQSVLRDKEHSIAIGRFNVDNMK
ncbi:hypothetical protein V5O48_018052, partial [Marasmius crinis-equi]